jgi:hypothetical protein
MSWLPIAALLALIGTAAAATQEAPATLPPAEVLDLAAERYERMTVPVSLMGEGPFRFIVDTGAQATVISHVLADRLLLGNRREAMLIGLNSQRMVQTASIPALSLGSRTFAVQTAALVDPACCSTSAKDASRWRIPIRAGRATTSWCAHGASWVS